MIEYQLTTAASVLDGFSDDAIRTRRQKCRDDYEKRCIADETNLPPEKWLDDWYPDTKPTSLS